MTEQLYVSGYFTDVADAEEALNALLAAGFDQSDLTLSQYPPESSQACEALQAGQQDSSGGILDSIIDFLKADVPFDPYSKEGAGPDSFRVAGQPCHGGYAHEPTPPTLRTSMAAVIRVRSGIRYPEAKAILLAHYAECKEVCSISQTHSEVASVQSESTQ